MSYKFNSMDTTHQEILNYISNARSKGDGYSSIKFTLLTKGWLTSEVMHHLRASGIDEASLLALDDEEFANKDRFVTISIVAFFAGICMYFINIFLTALSFLAGIVYGAVGVKSRRKGLSILFLVPHILAFILLVLIVLMAIILVISDGGI